MPNPNCERCFGHGMLWETIWIRGPKGERDQRVSKSTVCPECREWDKVRDKKGANGALEAKRGVQR